MKKKLFFDLIGDCLHCQPWLNKGTNHLLIKYQYSQTQMDGLLVDISYLSLTIVSER